jgi:hypothetical protein
MNALKLVGATMAVGHGLLASLSRRHSAALQQNDYFSDRLLIWTVSALRARFPRKTRPRRAARRKNMATSRGSRKFTRRKCRNKVLTAPPRRCQRLSRSALAVLSETPPVTFADARARGGASKINTQAARGAGERFRPALWSVRPPWIVQLPVAR